PPPPRSTFFPYTTLFRSLGDVDHACVIRLHRAIAERLQQNVVRLAPVRLGRVGGEQSVARDRAHAAQRPAHRLVEALFVGELIEDRKSTRLNSSHRTISY